MFDNVPARYIVYINDIIHKSFIEIDEEGTEAAAATIIGGAGSGGSPVPKEFTANRPFTYVIRNNDTGDVYFMGRYRIN